jgi:hypothetical protein
LAYNDSLAVPTAQASSSIEPPEETIWLTEQIDKLVYRLYDLTDEEIKIIENSDK